MKNAFSSQLFPTVPEDNLMHSLPYSRPVRGGNRGRHQRRWKGITSIPACGKRNATSNVVTTEAAESKVLDTAPAWLRDTHQTGGKHPMACGFSLHVAAFGPQLARSAWPSVAEVWRCEA